MAEQLEGGHALLIATHDLAVDQAGPDLKVVHGLHDEWVAVRRIVAPTGDKPDAHRVPPGNEPEAVVFDFVNPVGPGRGPLGWGRQTGFYEARSVGRQALTHTLDQHVAYREPKPRIESERPWCLPPPTYRMRGGRLAWFSPACALPASSRFSALAPSR